MSITTAQATAAIQLIVAVGDVIRELGQIPSGHLYAQLMGQLSLDQYQSILTQLKKADLVKELPSHLLVWTGPAKGGTRQ